MTHSRVAWLVQQILMLTDFADRLVIARLRNAREHETSGITFGWLEITNGELKVANTTS